MDSAAGNDQAGPMSGLGAWLVRMRYMVVLVLLIALLAAYARTHRLADAIRRDYIASGGKVVDLPKSVPHAWQRVCILGPYSSSRQADALLGFAWKVEAHSDIASSEDINLLIFIKGTDVVAAVDYPRADGDLNHLASSCYLRADAKFTLPAA
jgi:hypothetical protein